MSSTYSSMHTTLQVEDPSSSRRESTSLNLLKAEKVTFQKLDPINCKLELRFLAVAYIEHALSWTYLRGKEGRQFPLSILAIFSDYATLTSVSDIHSEAQFSVNNRDQWEVLGLATKYLYHENYVSDQSDDMEKMMMSGLRVDNNSRHWKLICSQVQELPKAYIDQA